MKRSIRFFICAAVLLGILAFALKTGEQEKPYVEAAAQELIASVEQPAETPTEPAPRLLQVYFLDVGEADAALLRLGEHSMLIDGGNSDDSRKIYSVLQNMGITTLDYIVCSHPHEDHAGGLAAALNCCETAAALSPVERSDNVYFNYFRKYLDKQGVSVTVPPAGTVYPFGEAEIQVLGPLRTDGSVNDQSLILRIVFGSTAFLFTGDAELAEETDVLSAGFTLKSDVLKVAHHGSSTSTSAAWLAAVSPDYAVISCGQDNAYGHPHRETRQLLGSLPITVLRTDYNGSILFVSDGSRIAAAWEREPERSLPETEEAPERSFTEQEEAAEPEATEETVAAVSDYVLNVKSMRFHRPECSGAAQTAEKNRREITASRQELLDMGYTPCGTCKP